MNSGNTSEVPTPPATVTMIAKYGKEKIELVDLPASSTSICQVKEMLYGRIGILPKRQKMIGLKSKSGASVTDETKLSDLKAKKSSDDEGSAIALVQQFILMGTPEEQIFVDPSDKSDLPNVVDDFDFDFNAGSEEWTEHKAKEENLQKFTEQTTVHIITPPRISSDNKCKPLLVLDLDHTLLDFSAQTLLDNGNSASDIGSPNDLAANQLKRPYMNEFLMWAYKYYDIVVWSQTSWKWLEIKLTELGMISHPGYNICFVLDKTSMFKIVSSTRSGKKVEHSVKPLQIIWSKFPFWGSHNTVHVDDLARNFALNLSSGLKCAAYHRKKKKKRDVTDGRGEDDAELLGIGRFLELLATSEQNFNDVDFHSWKDYVNGTKTLVPKK